MSGTIVTEHVPADRDGQHALAAVLAAEFADVLRRMSAFDGIGERAASAHLAALPDAKTLGDRLASLDFAFGPGVDHCFASWQLRSEPDEDDPAGEIQTDAALAIMLLNEVVFTNEHHWRSDWPEEARRTTALCVGCNDVFAWGCADAEDMTHRDVDEVFGFWEKDPHWGAAVWCMIRRRELPQRPVAERIRKAGVWDLEALAVEHDLRPNHYDGVSMAMAMRKRDAYVAWCAERGVEPLPFDGSWWSGWRDYVAAHPNWYDDAWKAGDDDARTAWRTENGFI